MDGEDGRSAGSGGEEALLILQGEETQETVSETKKKGEVPETEYAKITSKLESPVGMELVTKAFEEQGAAPA